MNKIIGHKLREFCFCQDRNQFQGRKVVFSEVNPRLNRFFDNQSSNRSDRKSINPADFSEFLDLLDV